MRCSDSSISRLLAESLGTMMSTGRPGPLASVQKSPENLSNNKILNIISAFPGFSQPSVVFPHLPEVADMVVSVGKGSVDTVATVGTAGPGGGGADEEEVDEEDLHNTGRQ